VSTHFHKMRCLKCADCNFHSEFLLGVVRSHFTFYKVCVSTVTLTFKKICPYYIIGLLQTKKNIYIFNLSYVNMANVIEQKIVSIQMNQPTRCSN